MNVWVVGREITNFLFSCRNIFQNIFQIQFTLFNSISSIQYFWTVNWTKRGKTVPFFECGYSIQPPRVVQPGQQNVDFCWPPQNNFFHMYFTPPAGSSYFKWIPERSNHLEYCEFCPFGFPYKVWSHLWYCINFIYSCNNYIKISEEKKLISFFTPSSFGIIILSLKIDKYRMICKRFEPGLIRAICAMAHGN